MERKLYINGVAMVSAQVPSGEPGVFFEGLTLPSKNCLPAVSPPYRNYLKPAAMRRMSNAVKMGVFTSYEALKDASVEHPTGIITGTGMGCKEDSDTFLEELINQHEALVSPTKFIQSTHNTVSGQIALQLNCNGYNFTYVQGAASFESALLDAQIYLESTTENLHLLLGGVDEISHNTLGKSQLSKFLKPEKEGKIPLLTSAMGPGIVSGEGAASFVASDKKTNRSYARLGDVKIVNAITPDQLSPALTHFLKKNELELEDIDAVVLGINADSEDQAHMNVFRQELFPDTLQLQYKHLVGEFPTASAIGFWLGCKLLKFQKVPASCVLKGQQTSVLRNVLLYNQYRSMDHSFTILQQC